MAGLVRSDLTKREVVHLSQESWLPSPTPGVYRLPLDRDGGEVARATTIVRFDPGVRFPHHVHGGGEEFLTLEGIFSDEEGHYPKDTYGRHPIDSAHSPWSDGGCVLLVKLRQMTKTEEDLKKIILRTDTNDSDKINWIEKANGRQVLELFYNPETNERVRLEKWAPDAEIEGQIAEGGEEILVLEGGFKEEEGDYTGEGMHWIRNPASDAGKAYKRLASSQTGCKLWIKEGHLPK